MGGQLGWDGWSVGWGDLQEPFSFSSSFPFPALLKPLFLCYMDFSCRRFGFNLAICVFEDFGLSQCASSVGLVFF